MQTVLVLSTSQTAWSLRL